MLDFVINGKNAVISGMLDVAGFARIILINFIGDQNNARLRKDKHFQ